ncbi:MAG: hemagglutinin protein [Bacteroidota bacterium]
MEKSVVSSSGTELSNSEVVANFTVGEIAVTSFTNGNTTLSQGFHQGMATMKISIATKVFFQGAMLNPNTGEESLMRDDLRVNNLIPTTSPYGDGSTCEASVFNTTGNDAIVDWVWIELRDKDNSASVSYGTSALLQRDGDIVATDGVSNIEIEIGFDNYYVAIKHRNHLSVMSSSVYNLNESVTVINFTDATAQITYGSNAQTTFGMPSGMVAMWAGDVNNDGIIQYSGTNPDTPVILSAVLNDIGNFLNFPTFAVSGYLDIDVDANGSAQYSGTNPDVPYILQNVLAHPGNFLNFSTYQIVEQMPNN